MDGLMALRRRSHDSGAQTVAKDLVVQVTADFDDNELARLAEFATVRTGGWGFTGELPSSEEFAEMLQGADVLAVAYEQVDETVLARTDLKYIASVRGGPGGNIDLAATSRRGIPVTGTVGREAIPVAEFALGLMLSFFRYIPETYARLKKGELTSPEPPPPGDLGWGMDPGDPWNYYRGEDLFGKTLGLVGLGTVGKLVADRANAFGMKVSAYDPFVTDWPGVQLAELSDVMRSDVVSIHARYSRDTTHGLVGADELALMPAHSVLINTARPNIVDRDALLAALQSGSIRGAALDVHFKEPLDPDDPFLAMPNVICTPHIAGSTSGVTRVQSEQVVDNILRYSRGEELVNVVTG